MTSQLTTSLGIRQTYFAQGLAYSTRTVVLFNAWFAKNTIKEAVPQRCAQNCRMERGKREKG